MPGSSAHRHNALMAAEVQFNAALVRKYDVRGPRYTSYPTAPQFSTSFDEEAYRALAEQSGARQAPFSLYVHIPFCRTVCFYCGCNKIITANYQRAQDYVHWLSREMAMLGRYFGRREVTQLHFGGGTPTYLRAPEMVHLMEDLRRNFSLSTGNEREFSLEIDPRTVDPDTIALLAALGFNRMSLGVQDFDPDVQRAVNRLQSVKQTAAVLDAARANGFRSTNLDLIYGLPRQSTDSFRHTLDTVLKMRPDRLAIYSYAHMPELFKVQRQINAAELPDADTRLRLLELSITQLTSAGYVYIGMDHFALPDDELARAQQAGTLQRNFQGYSTQAECDLVGLGLSSISSLGTAYAQNVKDIAGYTTRIEQERLPVVHGLHLTPEDLLRRDVIQAVMCQGRVDVPEIERRHEIHFSTCFATEIEALKPLVADDLVRVTDTLIEVTPRGRLFLRNVAMVFDAYLRSTARPRFSKAI